MAPAVALAMMVAGCGDDDSGAADADAGSEEEEGATPDEITIVLPEEPSNLDPYIFTVDNLRVMRNVAEPLVDIDAEGNLVPLLAESWEETSPTTTRITLREGVTFHDGTPLTSEVIEGTFVGKQEELVAEENAPIEGWQINIIDDLTFEVVTPEPTPILLRDIYKYRITSLETPPDGEEHGSRMGSGPYELIEWVPGERIVLEAFDDYWGGRPEIDRVTFVFRSEGTVRAGMIAAGEADIAIALAPQDITGDFQSVAVEVPETAIMPMVLNPPLDDARVREAINLALDRQGIADAIFGGFATPASQINTPSVFGYNPDVPVWEHDPDEASRLIEEARGDGVPVDTPIQLIGRIGIYPNASELMVLVAEQLRAVGLQAEVQMLEVGAWGELLGQAKDLVAPGESPRIIQLAAGNEGLDAHYNAEAYYTSNFIFNWLDTTPNDIWAEMQGDLENRVDYIHEIVAYHHDVLKNPLVPLVHLQTIYGVREGVEITTRPDQVVLVNEIQFT